MSIYLYSVFKLWFFRTILVKMPVDRDQNPYSNWLTGYLRGCSFYIKVTENDANAYTNKAPVRFFAGIFPAKSGRA